MKKNTKKRYSKKNKAQASLFKQTLVIVFSLVIGTVLFFLVNKFFIPYSLPIPQTTAINWLTVHRHSLLVDYLRVAAFVFCFVLSMLGGWFLFVWKKRQ